MLQMQEANISVAVCGIDNWRWVAYAFVDRDDDDSAIIDINEDCGGFLQDPIGDSDSHRMDASNPIWDPREYFLKIFELRAEHILKEWHWLVRNVEQSLKKYLCWSSSLRTLDGKQDRNTDGRVKDAKEILVWTTQAIELTSQLLDTLSKTIDAWEKFKGVDGDIGYFADALASSSDPQRGISGALRGIQHTFEKLRDLRNTLSDLNKSCRNSAQTVSTI